MCATPSTTCFFTRLRARTGVLALSLIHIYKPSGLLSVPGNQPEYYDSAMSRVKEKFGFCEPAHRLDTVSYTHLDARPTKS